MLRTARDLEHAHTPSQAGELFGGARRGKFKTVKVSICAFEPMEEPEKSSENAVESSECPVELRLTGLSALIAAFLIFMAIHCILAIMERSSSEPQRSGKRLVVVTGCPDNSMSCSLQTTPLRCRQSTILRTPASPGRRYGDGKNVRFAETTSVQNVESFYEPEDFYEEPQY